MIWAIIRFFIISNSITHTDSIYDFKKSWEHLDQCAIILRKFNLTTDDFKIAYRLIRFKHSKRECDEFHGDLPTLTQEVLDSFMQQNKTIMLCSMYDRMKEYWDKVLVSYKTMSARHKRLNYLIG